MKKIYAFLICAALFAAPGLKALAAVDAPLISANLSVGSKGEDVRNLQRFLNAIGFKIALSGPGSPGNETATFGSATRAALARYQSANGIGATGVFDNRTRILLAIHDIKNQIAALQQQLSALLASSSSNAGTNANNSVAESDTAGPNITALKVYNGGDSGYVDKNDYIVITFNEAIDPASINAGLKAGGSVTASYYENGGVNVSSDGNVAIKGIAAFDMGSVKNSGTFSARIALNLDATVLTVTLDIGNDIEIIDESLGNAAQTGGTVKDRHGNLMPAATSAAAASGTFGGKNYSGSSASPYIASIKVYNGGDSGFIDKGDYLEISFNKEIDPKSINEDLVKGGTVANLNPSDIGGFSVGADGRVSIMAIAAFDIGTVANAGTFASKIILNSAGNMLTVTLTTGSDIEISHEDFGGITQIGGAVKDTYGNLMRGASNALIPTGTFGGGNNGPSIVSIMVYNGGTTGNIDIGDYINVTFNEAIDPSSVNSGLSRGGTVSDVSYSETGGISVSSAGVVTIKNIATFDMGSVETSRTYDADVSLSSGGEILTIVLTDGNNAKISGEGFTDAMQIAGTITDSDGNQMQDRSIANPTGTFGDAS
jgi:peptidoglycan hydrolase-like protein with peptidoglycan-binding domain